MEDGVTGFNDSYEIGGLYRALLFLARDCHSHRFSRMYSLCALNHHILAVDTQTEDGGGKWKIVQYSGRPETSMTIMLDCKSSLIVAI